MSKESASTSEQRLEELEEGTRAAPKDSELCLTLGEAFLRVNKVDEAAQSYQRAVELDPRSDLKALYWEWLGLVREMEGRLEEALEAYFQWMDADPVAIAPLDRLGTLLVILGRWTDLRLLSPQFERRNEFSAQQRGRESWALYTFVIENFGGSEPGASKAATLEALEGDPDSPAMRFLLGLITYQEDNLELARAEFERVLELDSEGLWQENRFALDWNSSKARVMVAKLARMQGDVETSLQLLSEADELTRSDSEGLTEAAELLIENHKHRDVLKLTQHLNGGPSRLQRLRAESHLAEGELPEALLSYREEAEMFRFMPEDVCEESSLDELLPDFAQMWQRASGGESVWEQLSALRKKVPGIFEKNPTARSLLLLSRLNKGTLGVDGLRSEALEICRLFSSEGIVWKTAELVYDHLGDQEAAQLAALMASKLHHGSQPSPTGYYVGQASSGAKVLVGLPTRYGPVVLKLEADVGREERDQLFGWGRTSLRPGLELAKGVLENLAENLGGNRSIPELSFFPKSFRVMVTPISIPAKIEMDESALGSELNSVPLGFLMALLSVLKDPPSQRILVMGRLGLRGDIDGIAELEESLLAVHDSGAHWDQLLLAEAGGFRLLRSPAWLWHGRSVRLVSSAAELAGWQATRTGSQSSQKLRNGI